MMRVRVIRGLIAALLSVLAACGMPTNQVENIAIPVTTSVPLTTTAPSELVTSQGLRVVKIVDGDTIYVEGDIRVRLIGIDSPERGQCGYREASDALAAMVAGKRVVLVPGARTDKDRYGRVLRYVDINGVDANLKLIEAGLAIARYDSRDGYGRHPREDAYVAADAATASPVCR